MRFRQARCIVRGGCCLVLLHHGKVEHARRMREAMQEHARRDHHACTRSSPRAISSARTPFADTKHAEGDVESYRPRIGNEVPMLITRAGAMRPCCTRAEQYASRHEAPALPWPCSGTSRPQHFPIRCPSAQMCMLRHAHPLSPTMDGISAPRRSVSSRDVAHLAGA